jgi:hypothetical protein
MDALRMTRDGLYHMIFCSVPFHPIQAEVVSSAASASDLVIQESSRRLMYSFSKLNMLFGKILPLKSDGCAR